MYDNRNDTINDARPRLARQSRLASSSRIRSQDETSSCEKRETRNVKPTFTEQSSIYFKEWNHHRRHRYPFSASHKIWIPRIAAREDPSPRSPINALSPRRGGRTRKGVRASERASERAWRSAVRVFTGARCLARAFDRTRVTFRGGLPLGWRRGRWRYVRNSRGGGRWNGEPGGEGRGRLQGVPEPIYPCLNINDGRKWSRCFPRGGNFAWQAIARNSRR